MDALSPALRRGRAEVMDADLSGDFDRIPPAELLRLVARRVSDGAILALLKAWRHAPMGARDPDPGRPLKFPISNLKLPKRHPARRRDFPAAGQLASQPVGLAGERTRRPAPGAGALRRRLRDPVPTGAGRELTARRPRWLDRHGLKLNEDKTRLLEVRQAGFKFLGFGVSWRQGKSGCGYPHLEPHPKRQTKLRDKVREQLNPWTRWRAADEVIPELKRLLEGWGDSSITATARGGSAG